MDADFDTLVRQGHAEQDAGALEASVATYRCALALRPDHPSTWVNCGASLQRLGRADEALACYDEALTLSPAHPHALYNRGTALQDVNRHRDAIDAYQRLLEAAPDHRQARWNRALAHLALGQYESAWPDFELRLEGQERAGAFPFGRPQWHGTEDLSGRTLLVHPELGYGDMIQFARFLPRLAARGARVVVATFAPLATLFSRIPGVTQVVTKGQPLPAFDVHIPMASLPGAFRTTVDTLPGPVPYLTVDAARADVWHRRLAAHRVSPHIGLAWSANPKSPVAQVRACPASVLEPLVASVRGTFFRLHKRIAGDASTADAPAGVVDYSDEFDSFDDTAALIANLDLVITVDTVIAHVAGALGKPVLVLLPHTADWRWMLDREDSPWYPTARLLRQPVAGDWTSVANRTIAHCRAL